MANMDGGEQAAPMAPQMQPLPSVFLHLRLDFFRLFFVRWHNIFAFQRLISIISINFFINDLNSGGRGTDGWQDHFASCHGQRHGSFPHWRIVLTSFHEARVFSGPKLSRNHLNSNDVLHSIRTFSLSIEICHENRSSLVSGLSSELSSADSLQINKYVLFFRI